MKTDARLGLKSHIDNKAALTESGCSARGFTLRSRKTSRCYHWGNPFMGKLPKHVRRKSARGRTYFYFVAGRKDDGRDLLEPLPDITLPQFQHEYEVALAKRQHRPTPVFQRPDRAKVYFIGGEDGPVKIGWAYDPARRLVEHQCGSPVRLKVLATITGGWRLERDYHRQFAQHRLHGEWFARHPDILAEIDRLSITQVPA